jgi:hypothetical protein
VEGPHLESREAEALRLGHYRRVDVVLGKPAFSNIMKD